MRIISGRLRGRKLHAFHGSAVRPTGDRVRESLFNILAQKPLAAKVLDLFAGTGALGIEAISRGARTAVFVDNAPQSLALIRKNIRHCGLSPYAHVIKSDITAGLGCLQTFPMAFDLVFMDPPYGRDLVSVTMGHLLASGCLAPEATIVTEHEADHTPAMASGPYHVIDRRKYGKTGLSIYLYTPDPASHHNGPA